MGIQEKRERRELIIVSILFVITLGILVYLFPYSGDDWAWGSSIGVERLETGFKNYNGRYLGNLLVMLLTRSNILRVIVITLTLYGIVILASRFSSAGKINNSNIYLAMVLILFTPRDIWTQSVVWTAGYSNYVISVVLILIYFYYIKKYFEQDSIEKNNKTSLIIFFLGLITTLFMEHITLYSVILGAFVIVFTKIKFKRIYSINISYLLGTVIGTIIMFSNGAYRTIVEGNESYRSIPKSGGFIIEALKSYFTVVYKQLALNNVILNIILATIIILIVIKNYKKLNQNKIKYIIYSNLIIIIGYTTYGIIKSMNPEWSLFLKYTKYFEGIFSIVFYLALISFVFYFIEDKAKKIKLLFLLGSISILVGPLFVVKPIGPRCFFVTYVIFNLIVLELFTYLNISKNISIMKVIFISIISVQFVYMFSIYGYIYKINNERLVVVRTGIELEEKVIKIPELPYKKYVWTGDPFSFWTDRFKLFYEIPKDVEIITVNLKEWNKIK